MKSQTSLEPGVLLIFRLFIGIRVALLAASAVTYLIRGGNLWVQWYWFGLIEAALLFGYLSLPALQRRLNGNYLPLGIVWATVGPILLPHLAIQASRGGLGEMAMLVSSWQSIPVLFIPLVVVAWQYSFRYVVIFCVLTTLFDLLPLMFLRLSGASLVFTFPVAGVVMIRTVAFFFVGNMIFNMMKIQRAQREELTQANRRMAKQAAAMEQLTLSRERNRLARELHDVLAHTLSGLAVELEAVKALWELDPARAQAMLDHSLVATRDGLTETRRALQELRAAPLEDLGLGLAVRSLAELSASRSGTSLDVDIDEPLGDFPEMVQQCVYRVAQEALVNINQHAGARCLRIELGRQDDTLRLMIHDDGRGFDPLAIDADRQFGLKGMRERVEMIGGRFHIDSRPGQGTTVLMTYPWIAGGSR